jgi:hypothetical protein
MIVEIESYGVFTSMIIEIENDGRSRDVVIQKRIKWTESKDSFLASEQLDTVQVVKLTEFLPIDPRTRKPKHGAIDVLIKELKHTYMTGLRRDIVNKARKQHKK